MIMFRLKLRFFARLVGSFVFLFIGGFWLGFIFRLGVFSGFISVRCFSLFLDIFIFRQSFYWYFIPIPESTLIFSTPS